MHHQNLYVLSHNIGKYYSLYRTRMPEGHKVLPGNFFIGLCSRVTRARVAQNVTEQKCKSK